MRVKCRWPERAIVDVGVRAAECPTLGCFYVSEHFTRSAAGASGCSSRASGFFECGTRDRGGCPADFERQADDPPPKWWKRRGVWEPVE